MIIPRKVEVVQPQGKLVRALTDHIWDVAVDLRPGSPQFGQWAGFDLYGEELEFLWIPEGFAHGFLVLSETANVLYKTTRFYFPKGEHSVRWNDAKLLIGMFSVECVFLGLLGEYVGDIYTRVQRRPYTIEQECINFQYGFPESDQAVLPRETQESGRSQSANYILKKACGRLTIRFPVQPHRSTRFWPPVTLDSCPEP